MEFSALLSAPGILTGIVLLLGGLWAGHTIGRNNEEKRKESALAAADTASREALASLRHDCDEKLEVLGKASSNELKQLRASHQEQQAQTQSAHESMLSSLKSAHDNEVQRLAAEHQAERQRSEEALHKNHEQAIRQVLDDREQRIGLLERQRQEEVSRLTDQLAELQTQHDERSERVAALETENQALHEQIRDAKMNNMFSVSKSGEKLVRVVRSVQELASELDETSRTVTGGEYSFFDEIKDQRDRETVLSLTAGGNRAEDRDDIDEAAASAEVRPWIDSSEDDNADEAGSTTPPHH